MIISFHCADTKALFDGRLVRRFKNFERVALRKLRQLKVAKKISAQRVPPDKRLERLKGNRAGQYSIRINDQFRLCFSWTSAGASGVEIVDYH